MVHLGLGFLAGKEREGEKERAKERGRKRGNKKAGRKTFTEGQAGVFYNATDHRDEEPGGNGGSCESWRGEEEEKSCPGHAALSGSVRDGGRKRNCPADSGIPFLLGAAGHRRVLQPKPPAVTPVGIAALTPFHPNALGAGGRTGTLPLVPRPRAGGGAGHSAGLK